MPRISTSVSVRPGQRGFTLTELVVTIAIIGTMATIAAYNMTDYIRRSRLQDAARNLDGDLAVIRNTARVRQTGNIVVLFIPGGGGIMNSYRAFLDANNNLAFDAGEQIIVDRTFTGGVQLAVTSTGAGLVPPVTTVRYTTIGTIRDANRIITMSLPSLPIRLFRVTVFTTGVTRVERSDDGGITYPTRAW